MAFGIAGRQAIAPIFLVLLGVSCLSTTGCSVIMAARAPKKKDLSVLTPGVARAQVVSELGPPLDTSRHADGLTDVFAFKQGYSAPARFSRVLFHSGADFLTFGLWEIAGTPLEAVLQGEEVRAEVRYDPANRVNRVEYFAGAHLAGGGPTLAPWMRTQSTIQTAVIHSSDFNPSSEILPASATSEGRP